MNVNSFGEMIRSLRKQRGTTLRVIAAATDIDSTLLSKIERGGRFPTDQQIVRLARYFNIPSEELRARAIADKIISEYGNNAAALQAIELVREHINNFYGMRRQEQNEL